MIELYGRVVSLTRDYQTHKPILTLGLAEDPSPKIMEYGGKDIIVKISTKRETRSLDSNAYFHVLVDKLRRKLHISQAHCKNMMIARYGQIDYQEDGTQTVLKTNIQPERMREQEFLHTWPIRVAYEPDGTEVIFYRVYRGTHTYNTKEMSELIAGVVEECKAQDIETASPIEIARMEALWRQHRRQRNR